MSNPDLVEYIVEQAGKSGIVNAKKMFGDYCLYCDGKPVGLICDDYLYLKPLKQLEPLLHEEDKQMKPPYEGAKLMYLIEDIDNKELLKEIILDTIKGL